jgi:hypothetical protein
MTTTPNDNRPAPEPLEVAGRVNAAHREVDELLKLGLLISVRAERIKRLLTSEAIEQYYHQGMRISEIVDLYRDLTEPG